MKAWLQGHSRRLLAIRDTPRAIAGGVAIGIFPGCTPLFGLKTLLSLLIAWRCGANLIAATIAATLHDVALPFLPRLYRDEYAVGFRRLSQPHRWPAPWSPAHWNAHSWRQWTTFLTVGKPLLPGSVVPARIFHTPGAGAPVGNRLVAVKLPKPGTDRRSAPLAFRAGCETSGLGAPAAVLAYFATLRLVIHHRHRHPPATGPVAGAEPR